MALDGLIDGVLQLTPHGTQGRVAMLQRISCLDVLQSGTAGIEQHLLWCRHGDITDGNQGRALPR